MKQQHYAFDVANATNLLEARLQEAITSSRINPDKDQRTLAQAVDVLEAAGNGLISELRGHIEDPAFNMGLALGLYLLTKGGAR